MNDKKQDVKRQLAIADFELLHQAYLNLNALKTHTQSQKAWLSQYRFFREQLICPSVKADSQNIDLAVRSLLDQYSGLNKYFTELTRFTCREGDNLMYQRKPTDELKTGIVSRITSDSIVVGVIEAIEEEMLFGEKFNILEVCITVDITL